MRPFSTMMSIGPIGGAPVPSMMVALRSASRLNGPTPRSREVAFATTGTSPLLRMRASSSPGGTSVFA